MSKPFKHSEYRFDLYGLFIEIAVRVLRLGAFWDISFLMSLLNNNSFQKVRELLIDSSEEITAIDFTGSVFADAMLNEPMIVIANKSPIHRAYLRTALIYIHLKQLVLEFRDLSFLLPQA